MAGSMATLTYRHLQICHHTTAIEPARRVSHDIKIQETFDRLNIDDGKKKSETGNIAISRG